MKNKYLVFAGMGIELVGIILSCLYLGKIADEHFQTKGLALAGFPMVGLVGWIYHIILLTRQIDENSVENKGNKE